MGSTQTTDQEKRLNAAVSCTVETTVSQKSLLRLILSVSPLLHGSSLLSG